MSDSSKISEKIILALDGLSESSALELLNLLSEVVWVKVGLELFVKAGPGFLTHLRSIGKRIFLDLKFHDIPNTMGGACFHAGKTGAELITVHACAGSYALEVANKSAREGADAVNLPPPKLLAVTLLTSWDQERFSNELGINQLISKRVELLSNLASRANIGGCVCSPLEVKALRLIHPEPFELVTPGIRFSDSPKDDQSRFMSPLGAIQAGASRLVIGRAITKAKKPLEAYKKICNDLQNI